MPRSLKCPRPTAVTFALAVLAMAGTAGGCNRSQPQAPEAPAAGSGFQPFTGDGSGASAPERTDPAVATVDGTPVMTRSELDAALQDLIQRYERLPDREPTDERFRNQRRRRLVQNAVHDFLVDRYVATQTVTVTDQQIEDSIHAELGHVYEDERLFARFLESRGETRDEFFAERRHELSVDAVLALRGTLEPTDEEILEFYNSNLDRWQETDRVLLSIMTIRLRRDATEEQVQEALGRARELRTRVTSGGEDFSAVAELSSESADRVRGGDNGWVMRGRRQQLVADGVEDTLFSAPVGTITEPVRTQLGFQIFQIRDRRSAGVRGLDEVRDIIYEPLRRRQRDRLKSELVQELSANAQVQYIEDAWGIEPEPSRPAPTTPPSPPAPPAEGSGQP